MGSRTLPEGSSWTRGGWEKQIYHSYPIPEHGVSEWAKSRPQKNDQKKPWTETVSQSNSSELKHTGTSTIRPSAFSEYAKADLSGSGGNQKSSKLGDVQGISGIRGPAAVPGNQSLDPAERAEQNWYRRGPSPIQRNILARKLKEAQANSGVKGRQRSSTFSVSSSGQRKVRCHSLNVSGDSSAYRLSEAEQRMLDLDLSSAYVGETP